MVISLLVNLWIEVRLVIDVNEMLESLLMNKYGGNISIHRAYLKQKE